MATESYSGMNDERMVLDVRTVTTTRTTTICLFSSLPLELWSCIFSYVDSDNTALDFRLVSRHCRCLVDSLFWKRNAMVFAYGNNHLAYHRHQAYDMIEKQACVLKRILATMVFDSFVIQLNNNTLEVLLSLQQQQQQQQNTFTTSTILVQPQTRFHLIEEDVCFGWDNVPEEIRNQTFALTTATVLCDTRLRFIDHCFPNLVQITLKRGKLVKDEVELLNSWIQNHIQHQTSIPFLKPITHLNLSNSHLISRPNERRERTTEQESHASGQGNNELRKKLFFLPPSITNFKSTIYTMPFSFRHDQLVSVDFTQCDALITFNHMHKLKHAVVRHCKQFKTMGDDLPSLTNLTIAGCEVFDGRIPCCSGALEHLTLISTHVKHIQCILPLPSSTSRRSIKNCSQQNTEHPIFDRTLLEREAVQKPPMFLKSLTLFNFFQHNHHSSPFPHIKFSYDSDDHNNTSSSGDIQMHPSERESDAQQSSSSSSSSTTVFGLVEKMVLKECELSNSKFTTPHEYFNFEVNCLHLKMFEGDFNMIVGIARKQLFLHGIYKMMGRVVFEISAKHLKSSLQCLVLNVATAQRYICSRYNIIDQQGNEVFHIVRSRDSEFKWRKHGTKQYTVLPPMSNEAMKIDVPGISCFYVYQDPSVFDDRHLEEY